MMSHDREQVHKHLDDLLDTIERMKTAPGGMTAGSARLALISGAKFIAFALGEEAVKLGYGPSPEVGDRAGILKTLGYRMVTASQLFGRLEVPSDPASLTAGAAEARAVAAGDDPRIFVRGPRKKAYRLSLQRLRALEWHAYLVATGMKSTVAMATVAAAYETETSAVEKWTRLCAKDLGERFVTESLRHAQLWVEWDMPFIGAVDPDDWRASLAADGRNFDRERRATVRKLSATSPIRTK